MRRAAIVAVAQLVLLAGCHREPDFDERFDATSARIEKAARDIDAQVEASGTPPTPGT